MSGKLKLILKITLWSVFAGVVLFFAKMLFISVRYSKDYMVRDYFMDLGNADDYLTLPARELTASSTPFQFKSDKSTETFVEDAFQSGSEIEDLDAFLESTGTWAFMVIKNDTIIYERYFKNYQHDALVTSFSVAKSFDSALIGIAIHEGYIQSVNDPITNYLPELADRDPRFGEIQIRHLLMMTSGLRFDDKTILLAQDDNLTYGFNDLRHLALTETQIVEQPGKTFMYNNYNPILLGMILERATGKSVTTYLQEKIWNPIGMEFNGSWSLDSEENGFEKMESGLNARPVDFAKFGRLFLNGGNWNGEQLIPADWVSESTRDNGFINDASIFYGYMWWGKRCTSDNQDFIAMGNYGQYIYVSPANNLIIVRNGEEYGLNDWTDWADIFCKFAEAMP